MPATVSQLGPLPELSCTSDGTMRPCACGIANTWVSSVCSLCSTPPPTWTPSPATLTGIRPNPWATSLLDGQSGYLANPTPTIFSHLRCYSFASALLLLLLLCCSCCCLATSFTAAFVAVFTAAFTAAFAAAFTALLLLLLLLLLVLLWFLLLGCCCCCICCCFSDGTMVQCTSDDTMRPCVCGIANIAWGI